MDGSEPDWRCRDCGHAWRIDLVPLEWPDPRAHTDGQMVHVAGTVGRVVLEASGPDAAWADFELVVDESWPRLRCVAFPTAFATLDVALEPGLDVRLTGRISRGSGRGPELHVKTWSVSGS